MDLAGRIGVRLGTAHCLCARGAIVCQQAMRGGMRGVRPEPITAMSEQPSQGGNACVLNEQLESAMQMQFRKASPPCL